MSLPRNAQSLLTEICLNHLTTAIFELSELQKSPDRRGGILLIAVVHPDRSARPSQISSSFGDPGLKIGRYAKNAGEKFSRLFERRLEGNTEIASSESADASLGTYGGCIACFDDHGQEVYISISGGTPDADEASAYTIGKLLGLKMPNYNNPLLEDARVHLDGIVSED